MKKLSSLQKISYQKIAPWLTEELTKKRRVILAEAPHEITHVPVRKVIEHVIYFNRLYKTSFGVHGRGDDPRKLIFIEN